MNFQNEEMRLFTRPGFSSVEAFGTLETAYAQARELWRKEATERAAALHVTAGEYEKMARRGLVADFVAKNAARFAETADTSAKQAQAAALFRSAAKLTLAAGE